LCFLAGAAFFAGADFFTGSDFLCTLTGVFAAVFFEGTALFADGFEAGTGFPPER
jgi:hypothetical protein